MSSIPGKFRGVVDLVYPDFLAIPLFPWRPKVGQFTAAWRILLIWWGSGVRFLNFYFFLFLVVSKKKNVKCRTRYICKCYIEDNTALSLLKVTCFGCMGFPGLNNDTGHTQKMFTKSCLVHLALCIKTVQVSPSSKLYGGGVLCKLIVSKPVVKISTFPQSNSPCTSD